MTYAFTQDVPIDAAFYQRIVEGLGSEVPDGLVVHLGLRFALADRLPAYMIPGRLVVAEQLPLNSNGKLDVRAVTELAEAALVGAGERGSEPTTPTEKALCEVLADVFGGDLPPEPEQTPLSVIHSWLGDRG